MKINHRFGIDFSKTRSLGLWLPGSAAGASGAIGAPMTAEGTASRPAPLATLGGLAKRELFVNAGAVINESVGLRYANANDHTFLRLDNGSPSPTEHIGGFYFSARFRIDLWPNDTCRFFVGISSSTANIASLGYAALPVQTIGFMHTDTDAANEIWLVTRGSGAASRTKLNGSNVNGEVVPTLAPGITFHAEFSANAGGLLNCYLWDVGNRKALCDANGAVPEANIFVGPQCVASNGTVNTDVVGLAVMQLYHHTQDILDI